MKNTTREWVRKAEADYRAAQKLNRGSDRLHDPSCFWCQPSAEKYLKALMEELGLTIPRTHILKDVLALLEPHCPSLTGLRPGAGVLDAIRSRHSVTRRQCEQTRNRSEPALERPGAGGGASAARPSVAPPAPEVIAAPKPRMAPFPPAERLPQKGVGPRHGRAPISWRSPYLGKFHR